MNNKHSGVLCVPPGCRLLPHAVFTCRLWHKVHFTAFSNKTEQRHNNDSLICTTYSTHIRLASLPRSRTHADAHYLLITLHCTSSTSINHQGSSVFVWGWYNAMLISKTEDAGAVGGVLVWLLMHVLFKVEQVQPNCLHHNEGSHPVRAAVTDNLAEVQAKIHLLREKRLHTFTKTVEEICHQTWWIWKD